MIHRSPLPDVAIPDTTLTAHVLGAAQELAGKPALVDAVSGEQLTYGELVGLVRAGAGGLRAAGLPSGGVVGLMSHNQPHYAVAVHAVVAAGGVVSPLNPAVTAGEATRQLRDAGAWALVVAEPAAETGLAAARAAGVERVYVLGRHAGCTPFGGLLDGPTAGLAADVDPATALAALPYSSGTTGTAKGVMLTHRNLVANLQQFVPCYELTADDVLCAAMPFSHIYGFTIIMNLGLLAGATVTTLPRFDLGAYLATVERFGVTRAHLAPPVVLMLADAPEVADHDLSSLRMGVSGAAPLDEEVAARAERRIGCRIRQGYGMTEASPGTHMVPFRAYDRLPAGCVGWLQPRTECRVVDLATGADLPSGEAGELWVRGPQVMSGYLGNPAATAETLVDGWLRTGDIGAADADGVFTVVDRAKELIKYKGYQVAPAELEALLLGHPDVADAAVVGVPDAAAGELPKAFVVPRRTVDPDDLMGWVAERVAPYKRVRAVELVDAIPKSPSGKILRRLLRNG